MLTPSHVDDPRYEPLVASMVDRLQSEAATWDQEFPEGNTGEVMSVNDAARVVARMLVLSPHWTLSEVESEPETVGT